MHLSKVNETLAHRICGGSEYNWNCYGPNVRFLDYESQYAHASVLFDTETQTVYEATVSSKTMEVKPYRWLNPDTKQSYITESENNGIDHSNAWDDVNWCDVEVEEDFLEKAAAIFNGESFDSRIQVPLTLDKDELYKLMSMAHERDVTLNKMVEIILLEMIERLKNESTGFDNDAFY